MEIGLQVLCRNSHASAFDVWGSSGLWEVLRCVRQAGAWPPEAVTGL